MTNNTREEFEAWLNTQSVLCTHIGDDEDKWELWQAALQTREKEISELKAALYEISQGDGRTTKKMDKCAHGQYGFEQCESCIAEFAERVLATHEQEK
jgi:hypothetical protein